MWSLFNSDFSLLRIASSSYYSSLAPILMITQISYKVKLIPSLLLLLKILMNFDINSLMNSYQTNPSDFIKDLNNSVKSG
jgi:hypothetical protein